MTHVAKWLRHDTLVTALAVRVVLPLIVLMVLFAWVLLWTVEHGSERRLQQEVELVARAVRLPLSQSLSEGRTDHIQHTLESVLGVKPVYGAYVYGSDGRLVAASGAARPDSDAPAIQERAADGELSGEYQQIRGRAVYSYFVPLEETGGQIVGLLQVTRRQSDFEQHIGQLRLMAGSVFALLAVLILVVAALGYRSAVGKHVSRLWQTMTRVASGEREERAASRGPREIRALADALNGMLDSIAAAERQLTAQQAREQDLQHRLRQNQQLAAVGRLAAGVAHELGSPLSVIDGHAQRGLRREGLSEGERRSLGLIRAEVERMSRIVRQLLDFGRAAGRPMRRAPLHGLVQSAVEAVRDELEQRGCRVTLQPSPVPLHGHVDPPRLEQALTNLLRNAAQANPGGTIHVSWWGQNSMSHIQVEDEGPGIDGEHRERLFEPFFSTKPVGEGSGLGLAVAHGVISEHQGEIELVEGALGGAAFRISLPRAREPA